MMIQLTSIFDNNTIWINPNQVTLVCEYRSTSNKHARATIYFVGTAYDESIIVTEYAEYVIARIDEELARGPM